MLQSSINNTYEPDLSHSFSDKLEAFNSYIPNVKNFASYSEFELLYDNTDSVNKSSINSRPRILDEKYTNQLKSSSMNVAPFVNKKEDNNYLNSKIENGKKLKEYSEELDKKGIEIRSLENHSKGVSMQGNAGLLQRKVAIDSPNTNSSLSLSPHSLFSYINMHNSYLSTNRKENEIQYNTSIDKFNMIITRAGLQKLKNYHILENVDNGIYNIPKSFKSELIEYIGGLRNIMRERIENLPFKIDHIDFKQLNASLYHRLLRNSRDPSLLYRTIDDTIIRNKKLEKLINLSFIKLNNNMKFNIPIDSKIPLSVGISQLNEIVSKKINENKMLDINSRYNWVDVNLRIDKFRNYDINIKNLPQNNKHNSIDICNDMNSKRILKDREFDINGFTDEVCQYTLNDSQSKTLSCKKALQRRRDMYLSLNNKNNLRFRPSDQLYIRKKIDDTCSSLVLKSRLSNRNKFYVNYNNNKRDVLAQLTSYQSQLNIRPPFSTTFNSIISNGSKDPQQPISNRVRTSNTNPSIAHFTSDNVSNIQTQLVQHAFNPYYLIDPLDKRTEYFDS